MKTRLVRETQERIKCDYCGEADAVKKHTFLLENARRNPASSGYRGDDISWCSDENKYACEEHDEVVRRDAPEGMNWCATFPFGDRFPNMFLKWEREILEESDVPADSNAQAGTPAPITLKEQ